MRKALKLHHTKTTKDKKPRCIGLKKSVPSDVWASVVLPYYKNDTTLPALPKYAKVKNSPGKKKGDLKDIKERRNKKRRLSSEWLTSLSTAECLECLHTSGDNDMKWLVREIQRLGASKLRTIITASRKHQPV